MALDYTLYLHDSDKAAMAALKAIPGFSQIMKAFMKVWSEQQLRLINMSTNLHLSEKQMTKYYNMLPPICEKLGIDVPELFVELDVHPNAYTYGDDKPFIVITSGLFETLPDELISTVLAHECGHIACHHTLYTTMGRAILNGAAAFALSNITCEIQIRTLFEEIWGEIDHTINYPYPTEIVACKEQLRVLAKLVSTGTRLADSIFRTYNDADKKE